VPDRSPCLPKKILSPGSQDHFADFTHGHADNEDGDQRDRNSLRYDSRAQTLLGRVLPGVSEGVKTLQWQNV